MMDELLFVHNMHVCLMCFADALLWLPAADYPAEAARIHSNRALCLIKLATAVAAAAAGKGGEEGQAAAAASTATARQDNSGSSSATARDFTQACSKQRLASAAVDDCTAALQCCERDLTHKVG